MLQLVSSTWNGGFEAFFKEEGLVLHRPASSCLSVLGPSRIQNGLKSVGELQLMTIAHRKTGKSCA